MDSVDQISPRIRTTLQDYALEGDPAGIARLGTVVAAGNKPWFADEFAQTLRAGLFTAQWWGTTLYDDDWTEAQADDLDEDLREIWGAVAPGRAYPLDAPGG
ncbi:hypothetical protein [Actinocatenispora rupis]|uniref:hypothetical protein n=1 Tax=Actinocatenispora rupis TaxID=519421 RepID=UPI001943E756|nr:hypothetical protein [Actinocatenispora rupis]